MARAQAVAEKVADAVVAHANDDGVDDLHEAAEAAGLRYVDSRMPGYSREAVRDGFIYRNVGGKQITDDSTLARIRKLAIPPAYRDVWICRFANGHLQAVGKDARGRKQYRYHPRWREVRDEAKYGKMLVFGAKLPEIRKQVQHDLALTGMPRRKVLAAIVRLLETTLARIGNEEYARTNKSFGLTTLRNRHVRVKGAGLVLDFRAKHGIEQHFELKDRKLATIIHKLQDMPGQDLFQYFDSHGERHGIGSSDVNEYLQEITGEPITAKDFRTWAATNLAAVALREFERFDSKAKAKKNVLRAVEGVAKALGNTPAICKKCYIHPEVLNGYLDGSLLDALHERAEAALDAAEHGEHALTAEEVAVTAYLSRRLEAESGGMLKAG